MAALGNGGVHVVGVVDEDREFSDRLRELRCQLGLGVAQGLDERLRRLQTGCYHLLGGSGFACPHEIPGVLCGLCLNHGDGHVASRGDSPGDHHVEGGLLELVDVGEADPAVTDQCDAYAANRAAERQAGQLGGQRGGIDRDHVVELVRVQRHDGDDHLDLVAQALDEARTQRAIDEPAGEDRALGRAALTAEERAGDAARGVHPFLDVHREWEEVEGLARLALRGRGRQHHGVVVQIDGCRSGGLPG